MTEYFTIFAFLCIAFVGGAATAGIETLDSERQKAVDAGVAEYVVDRGTGDSDFVYTCGDDQ